MRGRKRNGTIKLNVYSINKAAQLNANPSIHCETKGELCALCSAAKKLYKAALLRALPSLSDYHPVPLHCRPEIELTLY